MGIEKVIAVAAKQLAPEGAELLSELMPSVSKLAGRVATAESKSGLATAENVLPKIERGSFSEWPPYATDRANRKLMDQLFKDPARHETLSGPWSASPTEFVDQWHYKVAPLGVPLETNKIFTCTALSVADRKAGLHYLAHIDNDTSVADIVNSVTRFDLKRSSVRLLPGPEYFATPELGTTMIARRNVEKTLGSLRQLPDSFTNFKFLRSDQSGEYSIVSHKGKLYWGS